MPETIAVAGAIAQRPGQAGHVWQFLQYLLGFRRLGLDVLFVDRLPAKACVDGDGNPCSADESTGIAHMRAVMEEFGLERDYGVLVDGGGRTIGLSRVELCERLRESSFLLNVMGYLDDPELLEAAPRRIFLDTDPGFSQMWVDLGLADMYTGHHAFVTIGENVGRPGCAIPTCGIDWITTPQPVVLDAWPASTGAGETFTSVGAWRGPYDPVVYRGESYGLRVHEFRRFAELPSRADAAFEIALDVDPADGEDVARLRRGGWAVRSPGQVVPDAHRYRAYVSGSLGEFMVAKGMYVKSRSGWFSERSMCYLASGRPVIAQDTGIRERYPTGEGLLVFTDPGDAVDAVEAVCDDYERHAAAARRIAEQHFDSDLVLAELLERLNVV